MIRQALILCGGEGTRLKYASKFIPKPLVEVGGRPFILYAINMLKGIGFADIILDVYQKGEFFQDFVDDVVRLSDADARNNCEIVKIARLQDLFLLLSGDSFPLMNWNDFADTDKPRIAMKITEQDASIAVVSKRDIQRDIINCLDMSKMAELYEHYSVWGQLHIGTPEGLQRARMFADIVFFDAPTPKGMGFSDYA